MSAAFRTLCEKLDALALDYIILGMVTTGELQVPKIMRCTEFISLGWGT